MQEHVRSAAPGDDFFRELEARRTNALVRRDCAAAEQLHADQYQLITPAGNVLSRQTYLATVLAEPFYAGWDILGEMQVRRRDEMAIVRYRARLEFPSGRVVHCWHTDSYELNAAGWQAVWSQATELPADTARS